VSVLNLKGISICRGEQAKLAAAAAAEAAAQQQAAMAAIEAEHKQETTKEPSPVSQVPIYYHKTKIFTTILFLKYTEALSYLKKYKFVEQCHYFINYTLVRGIQLTE